MNYDRREEKFNVGDLVLLKFVKQQVICSLLCFDGSKGCSKYLRTLVNPFIDWWDVLWVAIRHVPIVG